MRFLLLMAILTVTFALGCQSTPGSEAALGGLRLAGWPSSTVAPPPGIDAATLSARHGAALTTAQMPLDQVIASLRPPLFLANTPGPAVSASAEPPLAAQHAYVEGRQAWREHMTSEAVNALQSADRLAPNSPPILRSLGEIYASMGNRMRSALYFQQAVTIDPNDAQSLFVLGRFDLDQGKWDSAIVEFARALTLRAHSQDIDPGLWSFINYSLAGALERGGFDSAAIDQYMETLRAPPAGAQTTHLVRELLFLARQQGYIWLAIGDARNRLDQPTEALDAYLHADDIDTHDLPVLWSRLVYTQLVLHHRELAENLAVDAVRFSRAAPPAIALVLYVAAQGGHTRALIDRLTPIYQDMGRPGGLAVAIATLMGGKDGQSFLQAHLAAKPDDLSVGEQLIRQTMAAAGTRPSDQAATIRVAIACIADAPRWARRYSSLLLESNTDPADLLAGYQALPSREQARPQALYLKGRIHLKQNDPASAQAAFQAAIDAEPAFEAPRIDLAALLVAMGKYEPADIVLKPLEGRTDAESVKLRVAILAGTHHRDEALKLLDQLLAQPPLNIDLVIEKAALQRDDHDPAAAERTLLDALDSRPQAEPLYEALFDLYETEVLPDSLQQEQRLMRRMFEQIPQSRIARIMRAEWIASNEPGEAQRLLEGLLKENPRDYKVLDILCEMLDSGNPKRPDQAQALIDEALAKAPHDPQLLMIAQRHFERTGDKKRFLDVSERLALLLPPNLDRAMRLASIYVQEHRPQDAVKAIMPVFKDNLDDPVKPAALLFWALLDSNQSDEGQRQYDALVRHYPQQEADLAAEWASQLDRHGDHARAEQIEVDVRKRFPDNPELNNALGYSWANEGRNLPEAKEMLKKAVDAKPDESAFLDSLGWVFYKLGQYPEAVMWLTRAQQAPQGDYPVILCHLGDAEYRMGDLGRAVQTWRRGLERMSTASEDVDPEVAGLSDRLNQRIEAARVGKPAPVADVPGDPAAPHAPLP